MGQLARESGNRSRGVAGYQANRQGRCPRVTCDHHRTSSTGVRRSVEYGRVRALANRARPLVGRTQHPHRAVRRELVDIRILAHHHGVALAAPRGGELIPRGMH